MPANTGVRICPDCKTTISAADARCPHCGRSSDNPYAAPLVAAYVAPQIQLVSPDSQTKECPFCAETIKAAAIKCRFCGSELDAPSAPTTPAALSALTPASFHLPVSPVRMQAQAASPTTGAQESVYLQNADVTITASRAIVRGKTYAMANVTSVSYFKQKADTGGPTLLLIFSVMIAIVCGMIEAYSGMAVGILMCVGGIFWLTSLKPRFWVRIGSASAEANALWSHDENYIRQIVDAMNKAIVIRG